MASNETESKIVESIIDSIENNNVLPWHKPWDSVNGMMPFNPITGSVYSGINRIILMMRGGDSRYATFNQISAKGGKVIKGSKGITLVYYSQGNTKVTTDSNGDDVTVKGYAFARAFTVFNLVEHTTDLEIDTLGIDSTTKVIGNDALCDQVYQNMINKPNLYHGLNGAYYVPMTDSVHMPMRDSFVSMQSYYATLFHELTHATGHKSRLDRLDNAARFGSDSYSKEELVADLGGYFICAHTGITNESIHNNSVAYIASWLKVLKSEPKILISAASQAQKAVDLILNRKP